MIRVLVVDDSSFFRKRLIEIVNNDPELELAGEAQNGKEAITLTKELKPDVITMDVEMPVLNGIEAVRQIMQSIPTPVLMFSSLTSDGAQATLDALDAGASDFMPKNFDDIARRKEDAIANITNKLKELGKTKKRGSFAYASTSTSRFSSTSSASASRFSSAKTSASNSSLSSTTRPSFFTKRDSSLSSITSSLNKTSTNSFSSRFGSSTADKVRSAFASNQTATRQTRTTFESSLAKVNVKNNEQKSTNEVVDFSNRTNNYQLLAIGSSTGGPVALQTVLTGIPANFPLPILVIQHMPEAFTDPFAKRLDALCNLNVVEAKEGDLILPGTVYVAPGAKQMLVVENRDKKPMLHIIPSPENLNYRPSVDVTFGTAAKVYGSKVLAVVLTGMGYDGAKGGVMLKNAGSEIWAQNEETCVIFSMPKAVIQAGVVSKILPIEEFSEQIIQEVQK